MRAALPAALAVALLLGGCLGGDDGAGPAGEPSCTPGVGGCPCPEDWQPSAGGCFQVHSYLVDAQAEGEGAYGIGFPLPHGDWCLPPQEWLGAMEQTRNVTAFELRETERGPVVWLDARGSARWMARLNVTDRPECQTLRFDPWSTEPDRDDGAPEVLAEGPVRAATLYVREAARDCTRLVRYEGDVAAGWSVLPVTFEHGC